MAAQPDDRDAPDARHEPLAGSGGFVAGPDDAGVRLDVALARRMGMGRRGATRLLMTARVNGRSVVKSYRLSAEDRVTFAPLSASLPTLGGASLPTLDGDEPPAAPPYPTDADAPPQVHWTSETVLVLDKPAGLASIALAGRDVPSLARWLARTHPECRDLGGPGEAGLVHRLDTDTSGLIIAARTPSAYAGLRAAFRAHEVEKTYLAAVTGRLDGARVIELAIGRHPHSRRRARAVADERTRQRYDARPARTDIEVIGELPPLRGAGWRDAEPDAAGTLVRATTRTGAPHQIRVHLAAIGHALIGDAIYGRPDGLGHRLRAIAIRFREPSTGRVVDLAADPLGDERFARAALLLGRPA